MTNRTRVQAASLAAIAAGAVGIGFVGLKALGRRPEANVATASPAASASAPASSITASSPMTEVSRAIAKGDGMALAVLKSRLDAHTPPAPGTEPAPMTEADAAGWIEAIGGLRAGLPRFAPYGRASAVVAASQILRRFEEAPAPARWIEVLVPSATIYTNALADASWEVRAAALNEVKAVWGWAPRRDLLTVERNELAAWRAGFYGPVAARLRDPEPNARIAAVACLGDRRNPAEAEAAARLIDDPAPGVRMQVMMSFIDRPELLPEESVLPLLYDPSEFLPPMAERLLKTRGLSPEQIGLGKMVVHPRADVRASALPFLKDRADIDPVVWLLFLSRDREESVRAKALDALAANASREARQRVAEMAAGDVSPAIREAAGKLLPPGDRTAVALPPLPASGAGSSFKLKAN